MLPVQVNATVRRKMHAATLASLTDFHTERQLEGRSHPSMLDLPEEVWSAMVANSKRIVWPGQAVQCEKEVIQNENGEEETVDAGPAGKAATKAALLNAAIRLECPRLCMLQGWLSWITITAGIHAGFKGPKG